MVRGKPPVVRAGATRFPGRSGVYVGANRKIFTATENVPFDKPEQRFTYDPNSPAATLIDAFTAGGLPADFADVPSLPDDKLRIIVGPKP
jgi:hypothetical protein